VIIQPIIDLAVICAKKGIKNAVLSPGSRCAPISLAFARHPDIHCRTIADERSAAFIALGMAQQLKKPVVLVCTSGSAALNYGPAVAEAFFQQVPLLVITADRPVEWIDQWDGQTVHQENAYGRHVKAYYSFPDEFSHPDKVWHAHRIANEAADKAAELPAGPVHINIPIREPFYPQPGEVFSFDNNVGISEEIKPLPFLSAEAQAPLRLALEKFSRVLIVPGQQVPDAAIRTLLNSLAKEKKAVVVTDVISNMQSELTISHHDLFLNAVSDPAATSPDLVISFGKSVVSKSLKLFLRKSDATHWHIQEAGYFPDPFQQLNTRILCRPVDFLRFLAENLPTADEAFYGHWQDAETKIQRRLPDIMDQVGFGEFRAVHEVLQDLPSPAKVHLANSMPVRYVNYLGIRDESQEVICNRGTSGIDGSNSTAVGCSFTTKEPVVLITGDMAFFYDRNAFWHKYSLPNLRIILLNNQAGGIFRLINGSSQLPELEEFFETRQDLNGRLLAQEHGFEYFQASDVSQLRGILKSFYQTSVKPKILEITSNSRANADILRQVKRSVETLY